MQNNKLQQFITKRKSLIAQLACIKGEDMSNRVRLLYDIFVGLMSIVLTGDVCEG